MSLHNPEIAGVLRRVAAGVYDWLLVIAVMMFVSLPFVVPTDSPVEPGNFFYQLFLLLVIWLFFVGFWVGRGQTLGMRAWRLRIVDQHGGPISLSQATTRLAIAGIGLLMIGAGFWWQLLDSQQLSWHDRASGTRLILLPATRG